MRSIKPTGFVWFDDHVRALRRHVIDAVGTNTHRSRRNARQRVFNQLRALRAQFEEAWPALPREKPISRTVLKTARGKLERLRREGWKDWLGESDIAKFAAAGVRVRRVVVKGDEDRANRFDRVYYFVPAWAAAIGPNKPSELRAAKKSVTLRKAALVAEALT